MSYKVKAPAVTLRNPVSDSVEYFYKDAVIPDYFAQSEYDRLVEMDLIIDEKKADAELLKSNPEDVEAQARAKAEADAAEARVALEAEQAKAFADAEAKRVAEQAKADKAAADAAAKK